MLQKWLIFLPRSILERERAVNTWLWWSVKRLLTCLKALLHDPADNRNEYEQSCFSSQCPTTPCRGRNTSQSEAFCCWGVTATFAVLGTQVALSLCARRWVHLLNLCAKCWWCVYQGNKICYETLAIDVAASPPAWLLQSAKVTDLGCGKGVT